MIQKVLNETGSQDEDMRLEAMLNRVRGVDLNPLAVLTARVNYFINIAGVFENRAAD